MVDLKVGDIVARKSYGFDIFFKVVDINNIGKEKVVTLKGISYRIQADAPEEDLIVQSENKVRAYKEMVYRDCKRKLADAETKIYKTRRPLYYTPVAPWLKKDIYRDTAKEESQGFKRPGKILHIDGDQEYLETCVKEYKRREIDVVGKHVPEREQPLYIYKLLQEHKPDILVITGHDGISKDQKDYSNINSYINSRYFIEAVKEARRFNPDLDGLVIFAGACQSMYDGILRAGANFASAPHRVLIHALDPVMVTEKLAFTPIDRAIMPLDVINNTITGLKGIGGLQTRGKFRNGYPEEPYNNKITNVKS